MRFCARCGDQPIQGVAWGLLAPEIGSTITEFVNPPTDEAAFCRRCLRIVLDAAYRTEARS